ncbi:MAG: NusA-like transcription termination signal-binding factor [Nanoarchaeota archaeon]|nr:NusA-like transcription termination signal-binding factor [Nanoarchaeota archaeon]
MIRKFDIDMIHQINLFEKITKSRLKDIIPKQDTLIYIIHPGQIGKAIGKKGINIKKLNKITKKKIRIVEFNLNPKIFVQGFIAPIKPDSIDITNETMEIKADRKTKGLLIGKNQQNLRILKDVTKQYFNLDIKIK